MDQVARFPLGGRRYQDLVKTIVFIGPQDLSTAALRLQVRATRDAPGAPLADLQKVGDSTLQGITVLRVEAEGKRFRTTMQLRVLEATMRSLGTPAEIGGDTILAYDLQVTPPGGAKAVWLEGEFWVLAAVTGAGGAIAGGDFGSLPQPRPDFGSASATFQVGTATLAVQIGPGAGPRGQDAAPPDRVDIVATQGQTRFPAENDFSDPKYAFSYDDAAVVELNGQPLFPSDYTAPGGVAPIVLTSPAAAGDTLTVHSFKLVGPDPATALDRFKFNLVKSARQKMREQITLDDARQTNDDDDNNALLSLLDDGYRMIRLPGQKGWGDGGDWLINQLPFTNPEPNAPNYLGTTFDGKIESRGNVASGLRIIGDGMFRSVIDTRGLGHAFLGNSLSDDPADNFTDLVFQDIGTKGVAGTRGFKEPNHLFSFHGVTRVRLIRVWGWAYEGDFCWVSMGPMPTTERYNFDVRAEDCLVDGKDRSNRNAFSFESCDGWAVLNSIIRNTTRDDMPGPIDAEPIGRRSYRQRNGRVIGNLFQNFGGAAAAFNLNRTDFYDDPTGIMKVLGNTAVDGGFMIDAFGGQSAADLATMVHRHRIEVANNHLTRIRNPLRLRGISGLSYHHNEHEACDATLLGNFEGFGNREIALEDNRYTSCGRGNGSLWLIDDDLADSSIRRNEAVDCGRTDGGTSIAMLARRGNVEVRFNDNRFRDPNHRITAMAIAADGVVVDAKSEKIGNQFPDGSPPVPDTFNPPAPLRGVNGAYVSTEQEIIQPGATSYHDFTVAGAKPNMPFDVRIDGRNPSDTDIYMIEAAGRITGSVRSVMKNVGSVAITLAVGTKIIVSERI